MVKGRAFGSAAVALAITAMMTSTGGSIEPSLPARRERPRPTERVGSWFPSTPSKPIPPPANEQATIDAAEEKRSRKAAKRLRDMHRAECPR